MPGLSIHEQKDQIRNEVQFRAGKVVDLENDKSNPENTQKIIEHFDEITDLFARYIKLGFPKALLLDTYAHTKQTYTNRLKQPHNQSDLAELTRLKNLERKHEILVQYLTNAPEPDPA